MFAGILCRMIRKRFLWENEMDLKRMHHVAIIGSNYERSKAFYVNVLADARLSKTYKKRKRFI